MCMPNETNIVLFSPGKKLPTIFKSTYSHLVGLIYPQKKEQHHIRVIVGGKKLEYYEFINIKWTILTVTIILLNSTISTPGTKFITEGVRDFTKIWLHENKIAPSTLVNNLTVQHQKIEIVYGWIYIKIKNVFLYWTSQGKLKRIYWKYTPTNTNKLPHHTRLHFGIINI